MAGLSQGHRRALLPATEFPPAPIPRVVLPRYPRVGVTTACETCRKRKIRVSISDPRTNWYLTVHHSAVGIDQAVKAASALGQTATMRL